jgi:hypothetical protein
MGCPRARSSSVIPFAGILNEPVPAIVLLVSPSVVERPADEDFHVQSSSGVDQRFTSAKSSRHSCRFTRAQVS